MPHRKEAPRRKRRLLGAAGLSVAMASGASAAGQCGTVRPRRSRGATRLDEYSKMYDQIAGRNNCPVPRRRYSCIDIPVEGIGIQRAIVGNLGTHFDLWREPVLPSQCGINVVGDDPSPLPLRVHEEFGAQGEVVQFIW
jgi:hypothetical protein